MSSHDHVHWSRINGEKLDTKMGRLTWSEAGVHSGKVVLLGRNSRGTHDTLLGPISCDEYIEKYQGRAIDAALTKSAE